MSQWLKQSTAFTAIVGPILDSSGVEYTAAVIADLSITKNGTTAAMAAVATLNHIANGYYTLVGTTGNSDTLGRCDITCNKSTYQMPPARFTVLTATVFDALVTNATTASGGLCDVKRFGGTTVTGRDIGASVLLSSGTGTGQLSITSGVVNANWVQYLGSALGGTAAQVVAAITKFFNVASPTGTVNSLPDAVPGAAGGVAIVGSAMTLTSGERTSVANEVETQIIDETDAEKVLTAITNKIAAVNPSLGDLTIAAIAAGVRTNLTTELARIDAAISGAATPAQVAAALTDYDGPTKAEMDTGFSLMATAANLATLAGKFMGITLLSRWLGSLAGKTADATTLAEITATTAGAGYDNTSDSLQAIRDRGDSAWTGGGGGGSTTVVVAPISATMPGNTIVASGTTQAFRYCPLPIGPITITSALGPVDLSGGTIRMYCVNVDLPTDTFVLSTDASQLSIGGDNGNQISVDYTPTFAGQYQRNTYWRPSGETGWQKIEYGCWEIVDGPNPETLV